MVLFLIMGIFLIPACWSAEDGELPTEEAEGHIVDDASGEELKERIALRVERSLNALEDEVEKLVATNISGMSRSELGRFVARWYEVKQSLSYFVVSARRDYMAFYVSSPMQERADQATTKLSRFYRETVHPRVQELMESYERDKEASFQPDLEELPAVVREKDAACVPLRQERDRIARQIGEHNENRDNSPVPDEYEYLKDEAIAFIQDDGKEVDSTAAATTLPDLFKQAYGTGTTLWAHRLTEFQRSSLPKVKDYYLASRMGVSPEWYQREKELKRELGEVQRNLSSVELSDHRRGFYIEREKTRRFKEQHPEYHEEKAFILISLKDDPDHNKPLTRGTLLRAAEAEGSSLAEEARLGFVVRNIVNPVKRLRNKDFPLGSALLLNVYNPYSGDDYENPYFRELDETGDRLAAIRERVRNRAARNVTDTIRERGLQRRADEFRRKRLARRVLSQMRLTKAERTTDVEPKEDNTQESWSILNETFGKRPVRSTIATAITLLALADQIAARANDTDSLINRITRPLRQRAARILERSKVGRWILANPGYATLLAGGVLGAGIGGSYAMNQYGSEPVRKYGGAAWRGTRAAGEWLVAKERDGWPAEGDAS